MNTHSFYHPHLRFCFQIISERFYNKHGKEPLAIGKPGGHYKKWGYIIHWYSPTLDLGIWFYWLY